MSHPSMTQRIAELADELRRLPDVSVECREFPSGGAMLDARRNGRLFVLAYSPTLHFGVDEVRDGEGFVQAYEFTCETFEPAAERLRELVVGRTAPIAAAS